jgi:hypothetical protein
MGIVYPSIPGRQTLISCNLFIFPLSQSYSQSLISIRNISSLAIWISLLLQSLNLSSLATLFSIYNLNMQNLISCYLNFSSLALFKFPSSCNPILNILSQYAISHLLQSESLFSCNLLFSRLWQSYSQYLLSICKISSLAIWISYLVQSLNLSSLAMLILISHLNTKYFISCNLNLSSLALSQSLNIKFSISSINLNLSSLCVDEFRANPSQSRDPWNVPWMFPECSLNSEVHWMFPERSLNVHWMFLECSLKARWKFARSFTPILLESKTGFTSWCWSFSHRLITPNGIPDEHYDYCPYY